MALKKFTVILLPDDGNYQVIFPYYPNCITYGETVDEALKNAKEAMELHLEAEAEYEGDPVPEYVHVPHVVVGEVDVEVPDSLIETREEATQKAG